MTQRFIRRFRVRHYELDSFGCVNRVVLVRHMQEAAIEASTALGFSPRWYREHNAGWLVRRLSVRYLAPAAYGDDIEIATWISTMRGVRSNREYDVTLAGSGAQVARGRAEWVYMDGLTGQPARVPDEWADAFASAGAVEDLGVRLSNARSTPSAHRYTSRRHVEFRELDTVQHVNHAVYLDWVEQAHLDALRAAGHPPETMGREGGRMLPAGHEIQYFAAALDNEPIEIVSWVCESSDTGAAWTHEICNADTRKLLARDYSLVIFADARGEPIALPQAAVEDVLRGPPS